MPSLSVDDAHARLIAARVGRLATADAAGRPHAVPVCFSASGGVIHSAVDEKPKSGRPLRRLANIGANHAAALVVDHYDEDWDLLWWVRVDAHARLVESPDERAAAIGRLRAKYPQYGDHALSGPVMALDIKQITGWTAT